MNTHSYIFFDREPSLRDVDDDTLSQYKKEFAAKVHLSATVQISAYATLGLKPHTRFMLHLQALEASDIQIAVRDFLHTNLGKHLVISHTLLGVTRPSPYRRSKPDAVDEKLEIEERKHPERRYLIVYPFTKTAAWHLLPFEERREMMGEHVGVARTHSEHISQLLLYGYGIDDHEFIVSYECDSLLEFQTLVMELRATRGRAYTHSDTPIFTCVRTSIEEALSMV
jgi:chlorite dismutase